MKKPVDAIKDKLVDTKSSASYSRSVGLKEKRLDSSENLRYLFAASELEGGQRRATDPIWSRKVFNIQRTLVNEGEPVPFYLRDGPKHGFIIEKLLIVPSGIELPP